MRAQQDSRLAQERTALHAQLEENKLSLTVKEDETNNLKAQLEIVQGELASVAASSVDQREVEGLRENLAALEHDVKTTSQELAEEREVVAALRMKCKCDMLKEELQASSADKEALEGINGELRIELAAALSRVEELEIKLKPRLQLA